MQQQPLRAAVEKLHPTLRDTPAHPFIHDDLNNARINLEAWFAANPDETYHQFDAKCAGCGFTCKKEWRFAGLQGVSGKWYYVAPSCPVLWRFSNRNPLRQT